jgi:phospholipid transport system substrate-binding protein
MKTSTTSTKRSSAAALLAGLGLALSAAAPGAAAEASGARALIEKTVVQVIAVLSDPQRSSAQRRLELEQIAHARFDFRTMARLVLGRNWKRLDAKQQDAFVDEFTTYLANDYGSRIDRYEQEKVDVIGEEPKPRGDVVVKTKIVGGENDGTIVDYRMRERDGQWWIIDVVIEGISLVSNFRDQFGEVISRGGPQELLRKLREKNAASETSQTPRRSRSASARASRSSPTLA